MSPLSRAPAHAPKSIQRGLALAARAWFDDPQRPRLERGLLDRWTELLGDWCRTESLPLLIRKTRDNRGHEVRHSNGRVLVPADNSPAHWSLALAYAGVCPTIAEVHAMWAADAIPVAMVLSAAERVSARYRCTRQRVQGPNALGWKVAHIEDVGLGNVGSLEGVPMETLQAHFLRFLAPANMFLVPKEYAGVAETPEFLHAFRTAIGAA